MKKNFIYVVLIMLFIPLCIQAKKIAALDGLLRPDSIEIGNNRIYIVEGATIYVYSLEDYRLIKKFGKEGEGPREFKVYPMGPPLAVSPYNDKVYVSSNTKLSIFTVDGQFIKEFKVMPFLVFTPFLDRYVATGTSPGDKDLVFLSVDLYNDRLEKKKELYVSDMNVGPMTSFSFPINTFAFPTYKDRIYVAAGKEGLAIDVFDKDGNKLYRIKKNYEPLPVNEEYKQKTLDWFKNNPKSRHLWEFIKSRISFKPHFPAIRDLMTADDRLYVLTHKKNKGDSECIILDLKGNEQKRAFVSCPDLLGMNFNPKYKIYGRAFYTLVENEDEETWELHKTDL